MIDYRSPNMGRKPKLDAEKAVKHIRVRETTLSIWREQKAELGFILDDDYARYLVCIREHLKNLELLKKCPPIDVESFR